eukprot:scpid112166/ scgid12436/ 
MVVLFAKRNVFDTDKFKFRDFNVKNVSVTMLSAAGPSSTAALFKLRTWSNWLETLHPEDVTHFKVVFTSETGSCRKGAGRSENVGLQLEFGCRFFFFGLEQQEDV